YSSSKAFNWTYAQDRFPGFSIVTVTKPYIKIQTVKFENVSSVGQVQETDPVTTLPTGLVFWSMAGSNEYYIYSSQTFSNDATLATLGTSQGTLDPVFSPATYNYTVELPAGTSNIPFTFATTSNINAGYKIDNAVNLNGSQSERTTTVTVTAENLVTSNTYTIEFILIGNSDATLNSLSSDMGTLNPSFYPQTTDYSVTLPPGTTQIPVVSATTNDPQATMIITQPTVADGEASVEVTSQDGTNTMTYTIDYTVASVSDKEITSFTIPNQTGQTSINQTTGEIVINMPITTDVTNLTPTISYIGEYVSPASGVAQNFTNPVTYIVTAADSSTKTYSAEVILTTSNDNANLATLSTNAGSLNPAFSSSVNNYTVAIDSTVTSAIITASAEDPNATIHIYHAADLQGNLAERTGIVLVIAADGVSTKTYSIIYADPSFVSEQYKEKNVKIFPNPTTGIVNIEFSSKTSENLKLRIYSGLGLFIESLNIKDKTYSVDISDYPNGTYFFLIKTNSDIIRYKIIKTH
ncbi:MAG: cadherin-like beta sandwich domain-containing protein, partial [Bacteroidota bacterium]